MPDMGPFSRHLLHDFFKGICSMIHHLEISYLVPNIYLKKKFVSRNLLSFLLIPLLRDQKAVQLAPLKAFHQIQD